MSTISIFPLIFYFWSHSSLIMLLVVLEVSAVTLSIIRIRFVWSSTSRLMSICLYIWWINKNSRIWIIKLFRMIIKDSSQSINNKSDITVYTCLTGADNINAIQLCSIFGYILLSQFIFGIVFCWLDHYQIEITHVPFWRWLVYFINWLSHLSLQ
jgi:hypothetical protein